MAAIILTLKENKIKGESLLNSLKERGFSSIRLKCAENEEELLSLEESSSFDTIIFLGQRDILKKLSERTKTPLRASVKAIEQIEKCCEIEGRDALEYREDVLLPKGSMPILQKSFSIGCAFPLDDLILIYLPLEFDEIGIKKVSSILKTYSVKPVPQKGENIPSSKIEKDPGKISKAKGRKALNPLVLLLAFAAVFAILSAFLFLMDDEEDEKESLPVSEEVSQMPEEPEEEKFTFLDIYALTDPVHERMYEEEKERQEEIRLQYEEKRKALIEEEKRKKAEYEAKLKEQERLKKEEAARLEKERLEKERLEKERLEKLKAQQEQLDREELERLERERIEEEQRLEQLRWEKEQKEKEEQEKWEEEQNMPAPSTDEEIYVTTGGRVKSMNAYDVVLYAVQNETHGLMHPEALKAHAVASYTFFKYSNQRGVYPPLVTSHDISSSTKKAVDAVFGEAIYYKGNYINAVYHSTSCGNTASAKDVWGGYLPYLVSVDSSLDKNAPSFATSGSVKARDFKKAVEITYGIYLDDGDEDNWIEIKSYQDGGYVGTVSIGGYTTSQGGSMGKGRTITGRSVRENLLSFGIRSHCFDVYYDAGGDKFIFDVKGYGHGVGMSQYGAHFMAQQGCTYKEILEHYYTGVVVK